MRSKREQNLLKEPCLSFVVKELAHETPTRPAGSYQSSLPRTALRDCFMVDIAMSNALRCLRLTSFDTYDEHSPRQS